ncbi:MAG: protein kinase domain-containing protein [Planctomycetota bacterium]
MGPDSPDAGSRPSAVAAPGPCLARIGQYEVERELGRGGMGVVYLGRDPKLGRAVAVKLLPKAEAGTGARRDRFEREAQTAAKLNHPNIATIYELGEYEDGYFIAMEYVEGRTLGESAGEPGGLGLLQVLGIAEQIAAGLVAAHARSVVHRDLKPGNVMVTVDGRVKILDFGLAKALDSDHPGGPLGRPTALTEPGCLLGTVDYMSPEQARGQDVDARSDLFSFGALLFELITGRPAFRRATVADTLTAILTEPLRRPSSDNAGVPLNLDRIVVRLLEKDPAERYQSADEVLTDLREVRRSLESGVTVAAAGADNGRSIAVLPFADMSPARDQEYFCDGLAEELINALTQIVELRVAARTSAFQFKGQALDVRSIGQQLSVDTVLEGSVRKAGNRLRITAQLINISDGYHLWSQRYDRDLQDVFAVQDDIARTIVDTLKVKLVDGSDAPLVRRYTDNVEAYNLYLKGRHFWNKLLSKELLNRAVDCFEAAIELNPSYALAHAGLADACTLLGHYLFMAPREASTRALAAAQQAVKLDETLPEAQTALGLAEFWWQRDFASAEHRLRRAIELNPKSGIAHSWCAILLGAWLRTEEACGHVERSRELEPLSAVIHINAGFVYTWAGRLDEAVDEARTALQLEPHNVIAQWLVAMGCARQSRPDEAIAALNRAVELSERAPFVLAALANAYARMGREDDARRTLEEVMTARDVLPTVHVALVYTALGDDDRAFEWLDRAVQEGNSLLTFMNVIRDFDRLRADPRFRDIDKRIGLIRSRP